MMTSRRSFIIGLGSMLAAPAVVHAGNLMPVRAPKFVADWIIIHDLRIGDTPIELFTNAHPTLEVNLRMAVKWARLAYHVDLAKEIDMAIERQEPRPPYAGVEIDQVAQPAFLNMQHLPWPGQHASMKALAAEHGDVELPAKLHGTRDTVLITPRNDCDPRPFANAIAGNLQLAKL